MHSDLLTHIRVLELWEADLCWTLRVAVRRQVVRIVVSRFNVSIWWGHLDSLESRKHGTYYISDKFVLFCSRALVRPNPSLHCPILRLRTGQYEAIP